MQWGECLQNLNGAGQDQRRDDAILDVVAPGDEPPGQEEERDESGGQRKSRPLPEFFANAKAPRAHHDRDERGKSKCKDEEPTHYSFSKANTFTSTRRFFLLCSGLLASVMPATGLSQPLPITLNLFGSNLNLPRMDLRTESARS